MKKQKLERYEAPEMDEIHIETEQQVLNNGSGDNGSGGSTEDPGQGEGY